MSATYMFVYHQMAAMTPEQSAATMPAWRQWFDGLGDAVVDGGAPFGPAATVTPDGAVADGASTGLNGYSIVRADDLATAATLTKGCPALAHGGTVDVCELIPVS